MAVGPIKWFGGKGRMVKKILPLMPECKRYVEVFGGGAAMLFSRQPVELEVYNDLNEALYEFFKVLADEELFKKFYRRIEALPYSRQFYKEYRATWAGQEDLIERVSRWFLVARQCFGGDFGSGWGSAVTTSSRGMAMTCSGWMGAIERLPEFHKRLQMVQIENADFRDILKRYDTKDTLFYLDPPYVTSTRKSGKYKHEMTDQDHTDMIDMTLQLAGSSVISGYNNGLYDRLEDKGWSRQDFETVCYAAAKTRATGLQGKGSALKHQGRVETVWVKNNTKNNLFNQTELKNE